MAAEPAQPGAPNGETLVTIVYYARDDKSGLGLVRYSLRDPQGLEHGEWHYYANTYSIFFEGDPTAWTRYEINTLLPEGSPPGQWGISSLHLHDKVGNFQSYDFVEIVHFDVE